MESVKPTAFSPSGLRLLDRVCVRLFLYLFHSHTVSVRIFRIFSTVYCANRVLATLHPRLPIVAHSQEAGSRNRSSLP
jgi:hypothetical protein